MLVVRRRWKNSWEQTRHTHMQRHMHVLTFPVTMFPFFSITELHICWSFFTRAWNPAILSPLGISAIHYIMQIKPGSEDWERSRNLNIDNGGNDNEGDDRKSPVWWCALP